MGDYRDARDNAAIILECSNVCPFKWHRNVFGCPCCTYTSPDFGQVKNHMADHTVDTDRLDILRHSRPGDTVKVDVANLRCDLCQENIQDIETLVDHLLEKHKKPMNKQYSSGITPYLLDNGFCCAFCNQSFDRFITLNSHVFEHNPKCVCSQCGLSFTADRLRKHILRSHTKNRKITFKTKLGEYNDARQNASIILECSNVCPFKWYRNMFGCAYCNYVSPEFYEIKHHMDSHPLKSDRIDVLRDSRPDFTVKVDVTNLTCDLCQENVLNIATLMDHLIEKHDKPIVKEKGPGITPYLLDKGFTCAYCDQKFDRFIFLNMHIIQHNYKCACSVCGQFFSNAERLRNHTVRSHEKPRKMKMRSKFGFYNDARHNASIILECSNACPFKWHRNTFGCAYCEITSPDFGPIKAHAHPRRLDALRDSRPTEVIKAEITNLKCELCDQSITDLKTLLIHLTEIHEKPIKKEYGPGVVPYLIGDEFTCADCGLQFDRFIKLNNHVNEHYPNCICPLCGQAFSNPNRLKNHTVHHHKTEPPRFKCSICVKIFASRGEKAKHMKLNHGILPHKCPYCGIAFESYPLRLQHLNECHGKNIEYPCTVCSTIFKTASKRAHHMQQLHVKDKRFSCFVCDSQFISGTQLKRHMVKHDGERKYKCLVCNKAYPRRATLTQHMRIHNNDKRHVCEHCNSRFVQKCSLKSHIKTHHPHAGPSSSYNIAQQELPNI